MGKYTDQLRALRERRSFSERHHSRNMALYGGVMPDEYQRLNEQHHNISMRALDREIEQMERLSDQERIDEITEGVLNNLVKEGSQAAKTVADQLQQALKSIKL